MRTKSVTGHMIVCNEEQWVWYAINSVLPFVSKLLIYDTGSTDKTIAIIKAIKSSKIVFAEKGSATPKQIVDLRNEQLEQTSAEWFLLLDGDEVWSRDALLEHLSLIKTMQDTVMGIVVPARMCVGDLYHIQDDTAGKYELLGKKGHFNIRMYRKRKGWQWRGVYPLEAYVDTKKNPIQSTPRNLIMANHPYWHLSFLKRSSVDTHGKQVLEIGKRDDRKLPEVFFKKRPSLVPPPTSAYSLTEFIIAVIRTPLVWLKRRLI